jgi:hypothetical protein
MNMEHGFRMSWIIFGFGAVVVAKIAAAALNKYLHLAM